MMSEDLISRQNAIEGVRELFACADIGNDECDITFMLENLPSARPIGKWELQEEGIENIYLCSYCRNYEAWGETEKTPYCPQCGAEMEIEHE